MPLTAAEKHAQLTSLIGAQNVIGEPDRMASYLNEPRRRFHTGTAAIALPSSVEQVQAIMRWAAEHRVGMIPQGGNTGLVGAQVPLR
ncbi:MAG TPA: FAD-binding protein, partial [Devosia sp.]|nr:FAD-binding protein [Devosia sp.]